MLRTALRPRYLGLLALMVAATLACGLLASWQWDRAHRELTSRDDAPATLGEVTDVLEPGEAVTNRLEGGIVTATGSFEPSEQVLVGGRQIDGTSAAIVVTALDVELSDGSSARLPVARGWTPADQVTGPDGELDPDLAPDPPAGEVDLTGRLEASEAATDGISGSIASEIATPLLVNAWGGPMFSGYVGQTSAAEGLAPMPEAQSAFSRGLDWQNIGYATQWILFGAFFLYLWWRSVRTAHLEELEDRREALRRSLEDPDGQDAADPPGPADPDEAPVAAAPTSASAPTSTSAPTSPKDV